MTENLQIQPIEIQNKIYTIRGLQVMIDVDLASLYGVETKVLNQAVKRNIERFPDSFRFQLTDNEFKNCSRSQIVTLNETSKARRGYTLSIYHMRLQSKVLPCYQSCIKE